MFSGISGKGDDMSKLEKLIGKLTGYRCKNCSCCLWQNQLNNVWCSECDFEETISDDISEHFHFVEIPNELKLYWGEYLE